jgi:polyhydroxyalkanoate synthesis regulator phasin
MDYHDKNDGKGAEDSLWKVSRVTGADYKNLEKLIKQMVKAGKIPKKYAIQEENDAVDRAKDRIQKEKDRNKEKYDRILDRARLIRTKRKNRET